MTLQQNILLAFYGDDFTGSTDALEFASNAGATAMLFIKPPTADQLAQYPLLNVIGVAGATRSMSPQEMEDELLPAFDRLKSTGATHIHYKVCSTFDSSPTTGSIGKAMDIAQLVFPGRPIPVLGGMPALGRYCVFGNLFAKMGIGSNGEIYRLDRHPSMINHPVTPANESDLIHHLQKQTSLKGHLIDIIQQAKPIPQWLQPMQTEPGFILFDALHEQDLLKTGEWLEDRAQQQSPLFSIGSSGIEMALGKYWNSTGKLKQVQQWPDPGVANPLLVVSGSCSPVTEAQISYAARSGFQLVELNAAAAIEHSIDLEEITDKVNAHLEEGQHVLVHTGARQSTNLSSRKLGSTLGLIGKSAAEAGLTKRIIIAGGDTSSYAARAMEIDAVSMIAPLVNGAPLCRAHAANQWIDGLEVNFKGGQVGAEDYFTLCVRGKK
ncbi:MAG: four-carbon acid sugar kinase family protein [Chitinophagaceae bacterium]